MNIPELTVGCRPYRRFTQKPIPAELLTACLENARLSSTGANAQTLRFICVQSPEMVAKMQPLVKWAAALPPEIGTPKPEERPTAFIVIVKKAGSGAFADVDVGIAAHAIVMTAWEGGVGSCMMGAINRPEIARLLGVDEADTVHLAIALGYPGCTSTIVPVPESGLLKYYVDADRNYYVPKKSFDELVKIV